MYTMSSIPSTSSVISTYTAFAASAMLARSVIREVQSMTSQIIPKFIRDKIIDKFRFLIDKPDSEMNLIIDQFNGPIDNQVYEASQLYLKDKISPSNTTLKITKSRHDKTLSITPNKGEEIIDFYQGIRLKWVLTSTTDNKDTMQHHSDKVEHRSLVLSFLKIHTDVILDSYLPHILKFAKSKRKLKKVVKLSSLGGGRYGINLNHPSTFDTLALDPSLKKAIIDDLDRFVKRKQYYKRVGKAWKRGYLLYGPPGTGKSSLIAAMANYLKFNVYDLDLTGVRSNGSLRSLLLSTQNRSILVIEDIDCGVELQNRSQTEDEFFEDDYEDEDAPALPNGTAKRKNKTGLTLSGLLNFSDGLWSGCGDQRIIVFTTNYKDKIDPALLRPGRMDMHIHMSYLTPSAFRILAFNYLGVNEHPLFAKIEDLLGELEVTPAAIAEELMGNDDDPDAALESLMQLLENKRSGEKESIEAKEEIEEGSQNGHKGIGSKRKLSTGPLRTKQAKLCHGDKSTGAATTLNVEGCPELLG